MHGRCRPADPVVQRVKPEPRLPLGLPVPELPELAKERLSPAGPSRSPSGVRAGPSVHPYCSQWAGASGPLFLFHPLDTFRAPWLGGRYLRRCYYGPIRLLARHARRLCLSRRSPARRAGMRGLWSSRSCLWACAVPFDPGEPDDCVYPLLDRPYWLHHLRRAGRSRWRNEADLGSLALWLTPSPCGASSAGSLRPDARSATWQTGHSKVSSFQLTRQNRFH
jgi:hypothetical protein